MFAVSFDTDNAAFAELEPELEVARILRALADDVELHRASGKFQPVRDSNGNTVGTWKLNYEEAR